jgi:acetolactate synthase-1/2/3 large subunit
MVKGSVRGYEVVARTLESIGSDCLFGVMGSGNVPIIGELTARGRMRYVAMRHESGAVNAAAGYSWVSGHVGVCAVTHGPGLANAFNALTAAARDRAPIVLLVGGVSRSDPGNLQRIDQRAIAEAAGAVFVDVETADALASVLIGAVRGARMHLRPHVVQFCVDLLHGEFADDSGATSTGVGGIAVARVYPTAGDIALTLDLIEQSCRPVLVAGQGAVYSGALTEIVELADATGALLATSMLAKGSFTGHPHDLGIAGGFASARTQEILRAADCVVAFGASLNKHTTKSFSLFANAAVVQVDCDPAAVGTLQSLRYALVGDAKTTAAALLDGWRERGLGVRDGYRSVTASADAATDARQAAPRADASGLDPSFVLQHLQQVLPANRIVVCDGGRFSAYVPTGIEVSEPRSYVFSAGFASISLGLGNAVGAALAAGPGRRTVLLTGDGGFMMALPELDAAVRAGVDVLIVVFNDQQYGAEIENLRRLGLPTTGATFETPDLSAVATVLGGRGALVRTRAEFEAVTSDLVGADGVFLVDVRVDPDAVSDLWG